MAELVDHKTLEYIPTCRLILGDIETTAIKYINGVKQIPDTVHCLVAEDYDAGVMYIFEGHDEIRRGVEWIKRAEMAVFHNAIGFDQKVLDHHFGMCKDTTLNVIDSMVMLSLLYSNIKDLDFDLWRRHLKMEDSPYKFTGDLIGARSLEAWGLRLNPPMPKGAYTEECKARGIEDPWAVYTPEMRVYALQDVNVLSGIWREKIEPRLPSTPESSIAIEHYLADVMEDLKTTGIKFDVEGAHKLVSELESASQELYDRLQEEFPPRLEPDKWILEDAPVNAYTELMRKFPKNPIYRPHFALPDGYEREMWGEVTKSKVNRTAKFKHSPETYKVLKYDEDGNNAFVKCSWQPFNPASRIDIVRRLLELGWKPTEFTEKGSPQTGEEELNKIEEQFPAAKSIVKYLTAQRRLAAVSTGDMGWLKLVDANGFIHPTIYPQGTVTFRATHSNPNISQVASIKKDSKGQVRHGQDGGWGWESRALFGVPAGFKMVGADLSGLELRCLAHYLFPFDNGHYAYVLLNEDMHENIRVMLGFNDRRDAKEFKFAMIYGGGNLQLGSIALPLETPVKQEAEGKRLRARIMTGITGFERLLYKIEREARKGYLIGLDGRRVPVRKAHAALNSSLQTSGAIISKYWIVEVLEQFAARGWRWGYDADYTLMIYSHDELQFAVRDELAEEAKQICIDAAPVAGDKLKMRIPIAAEAIIGNNWAETH